MSDFVTATVLAKLTGLDRSGIRRQLEGAYALGEVEQDDRGRWHREQALAFLNHAVDPAKVAGHNSVGRGGVKGSIAETAALAKARAQSEAERARKLRLHNDQLAGTLVYIDDVRTAGADVVVRARQAFLSLGHRVAGRVVGRSDPIEVACLIEAEARAILNELADPERFVAAVLDTERDE